MVKSKKEEKAKKTVKSSVKSVAKKTTGTKKKIANKSVKAKKTVIKKAAGVKKAVKKPVKSVKLKAGKIGNVLKTSVKSGSEKLKTTTSKVISDSPIDWLKNHGSLVLAAFSVFLLGCILGMLSMDAWIVKSFGSDQKMVVTGGKTWLPVDGNPIDLIILNDKKCGASCDVTPSIAALKQNISPALIERVVDINSKEGIKLIAEFNVTNIPQFFFGKSLESIKGDNGKTFIENLPKGVLELKGDLYALNNAAIGFPTGKFIKVPKFKDLDIEPKKGTGKIQVVEFTDYQCPYCKRLHDQNKTLIDRLIREGKITYILKDFPLGFHGEAAFAHKAANCVLKNSDNETYWKMHDLIFETVSQWNRKGEAAKTHFNKLASNLGVEIAGCVDSQEIANELTADQQEGAKYGVRGTPALFIGTQMMPGAIDAAAFEKAVNDELGK